MANQLSPEMLQKWVNSNIKAACDEMWERGKDITPASLARYFTKWSDGLELNEQEAKGYLESCDWYNRAQALEKCLEAFMASNEFPEALAKGTCDSWGGGGTNVELCPSGIERQSWRVLFNNEIGNLYESPGEILGLPTLDDDDYQKCVVEGDMTQEEYFFSVFQNHEEELKQGLRDKLAGRA